MLTYFLIQYADQFMLKSQLPSETHITSIWLAYSIHDCPVPTLEIVRSLLGAAAASGHPTMRLRGRPRLRSPCCRRARRVHAPPLGGASEGGPSRSTYVPLKGRAQHRPGAPETVGSVNRGILWQLLPVEECVWICINASHLVVAQRFSLRPRCCTKAPRVK